MPGLIVGLRVEVAARQLSCRALGIRIEEDLLANLTAQLEINQCPHCGVNSPNLNTAHIMQTESRLGKMKRYWHVYVCQR